ncbi:MAG TPA: 50S ribosome-binding GTPase [Candidatus Hydrogenedentes bacterium]|nr:50S ribosome-binding GTPase [Candidatus Hydrogenedentota bacterium]
MKHVLGQSLSDFAAALNVFRGALEPFPELSYQLFAETEGWTRLLVYKLLPHLEGDGCLVVAVAGGTNTGKSTIFNLLLGEEVSPVCPTAAATCRPVLAGNATRVAQCLEGKLVPEFKPMRLECANDVISGEAPGDAIFVAQHDSLTDRLVLLDIPDVDSIERQHWELAENIQAAGDVLVAVLTAEKYKDERVVSFFKRARTSGRIIIPLMNKADPYNGFEVARRQLEDFCGEIGVEDSVPIFVTAHDFKITDDFAKPILSLNGAAPLRAHVESLDVAGIKEHVYRNSVDHMLAESGAFLERAMEMGETLRRVTEEFERRAETCASRYDPEPGEDVGKVLHEFIASKRGLLSRTMSKFGNIMDRYFSPVGRMLTRAVRGRTALEGPLPALREETLLAKHRATVETFARELTRDYLQSAQNLQPPAAQLILDELGHLNTDEAAQHAADAMLGSSSVSRSFRDHVHRTIDVWWNENFIMRQVLLELDALLIFTPTAIAVPLSFYTGGVGVPEVLAAAGPFAGIFFARIMEEQFAAKWFDLMEPWRREQQQRLRDILIEHITHPALSALTAARKPFDNEMLDVLRRHHDQCRKAC